MPRDGKKSLTVSEDTYETLRERKPETDTWDEFLEAGAKSVTPYPESIDSQLKADEQTRRHLEYIDTREDDLGFRHEIYFWPYGGMFLRLMNDELIQRENDQGIAPTKSNGNPVDGEQ
jgi:hypothetical protein